MLRRNGVLAVSFCFLYASAVFSEEGNAPFGLTWGMTEAQVAQLVEVEIKEEIKSDLPLGVTGILQATSLPKNLTIAEFYHLIFVTEKHLQKISMSSKDIEDDVSGRKGKEQYEKIKTSLKKKYGSPIAEHESSGRKLWDEWDEFYQCLKYDGCGIWASIFEDEKSGMMIGLELKGLKRGRGFIQLGYEGPSWEAFLDAKEKIESELDDDAL